MAVFPQLLTGALAQFAFEKRLEGRAVVNRAADDSTYAAADPAGRRVQWTLNYAGLAGSEFAAVESLFQASEGRLQTFTFCDPTANLLGWTENFSAAAWQKDALLTIGPGTTPPGGVAFHLVNGGAGWSEIGQTIAAPIGFTYAFSIWVLGTGSVRLRRYAGANSEAVEYSLTGSWQRIVLGGALSGTGVGVTFAIGVPVGGAVDVAGPMVEAQLVAGEYKASAGAGGVYPAARFGADQLLARIQAPNWVDLKVTVESRFED